MNELVSIIMPSYNTSKFITDSIRSVQKQTYNNWELIIIDDCSIDETNDVVEPFLADKRIKFYRNKKNSGAAISRNKALVYAKGKWIAFLDSDDLWLPEKLEKQILFMEANKYDFTYTYYAEMNEDGTDSCIYVTGPKRIGKVKMHMFNYIGCLTAMYNIEAVGIVQVPDLKKRNDWAMWLKVVEKTPCYLLPENLSTYRVRKSGSLTHNGRGKISLIKYHYTLFRAVDKLNPGCAFLLALVNLVFGILKKCTYRKHIYNRLKKLKKRCVYNEPSKIKVNLRKQVTTDEEKNVQRRA